MAKALAAIEAACADKYPALGRRRHAAARLAAGGALISRIDLLYPDPWPKRRHWKRRFVQDESLARLARLLKSGGEFRFATDIPGYVVLGAGARRCAPIRFEWTAERADDWRKPWPDFAGTRYEAKAKREGRDPGLLHVPPRLAARSAR